MAFLGEAIGDADYRHCNVMRKSIMEQYHNDSGSYFDSRFIKDRLDSSYKILLISLLRLSKCPGGGEFVLCKKLFLQNKRHLSSQAIV
jgi:hypothetical protein